MGIEFTRSGDEIIMTQQKYISDLLKETKHTQCHVSDTPIEVNERLTLDDKDPKIEITSYQKLIGKLLYLSHTRLDICYSVNVLCQFMHSPRNSHFQASNRVLRYLRAPLDLVSPMGRHVKLILFYILIQILQALELTIGPQRDTVLFFVET